METKLLEAFRGTVRGRKYDLCGDISEIMGRIEKCIDGELSSIERLNILNGSTVTWLVVVG